DTRSPLSDINVGSVTRTLGEAIGREVATVYQQINEAYLAGFVDTAKGLSLDLVVSILGVMRKTREYAVGLVTFFRDPSSGDGNITIPEGTVLSTDKEGATFVTVALRTIQRGQARIDVPVRAAGAAAGEAGIVKAGEITKTAQPITGISRVTNFEPTILGAEDETDEQLRARAKAALRSLGKATIAALTNAVFEGRGRVAEVFDPNGPPLKRSTPGTVTLLVESEPERFPSLQVAVEQTRAAGVLATLVARYIFFKPRIRARIAPGLTADGKLKLVNEIIQAMQKYVDTLSVGDPATGEELLKAITSVKEVSKKKGETKIVDVMAWRTDVGQPGPEALVKALVEAASAIYEGPAVAEEARKEALMVALNNVFAASAPPVPTGRRIPARDLVQGLTGQRATDAEIEAGTFKVVSVVGAEKWWVVLDVEPADILLDEV
ncbi:MAG TPA: baseplate J/gp47 family protein, partial [Pyrinomonadaceae bacterium]|nr:baseplate J/gp47 family protein [Pyrinomonadaceae bacterium]